MPPDTVTADTAAVDTESPYAGAADTRSAVPGVAALPATATSTGSVEPPLHVDLTRPSVGQTERKRILPRLLVRAVGPIAVLVGWYLLCRYNVLKPSEIASPGQTWSAAKELWHEGQLQSNLWVSLRRVLQGLGLGVSVGLILAVLSGFFHIGEDLIDPLVQAIRAVPIFGLLPLFLVWFGIGETPKIFLIALGCVFPVYLNTYGAIRGVDTKLIEAGQTFGLSKFGVIGNIVVPGALPGFLVGLRFALVHSWLMVIVAEQLNAQSGIGYLIIQAETVNRIDIMFVGLAVYAILGILVDLLVRQLEKRLLVWRNGFVGS